MTRAAAATTGSRRRPRRALAAAIAAATALGTACGSDGEDAAPVLVLGAFPAEVAPLVEAIRDTDTTTIDGRSWWIGELAGQSVIVGMTGIGLVNAERSSQSVLDRFAVRAVVFSGVAGSPRRIGDVVVAEQWTLGDGDPHRVDATLLEVAAEIADEDRLVFGRCTELPAEPQREPVCVAHRPRLFVGGRGTSSDPFGGVPLPCQPGGDDVFGCEVHGHPTPPPAALGGAAIGVEPDVVDMESAAVARVAALRGIPFIAFRGVSDGSGDPLDLPGFPAQFFAYYRLAARNAAVAAVAFLEKLGDRPSTGETQPRHP